MSQNGPGIPGPYGSRRTVKASQLMIEPTTDIERPQISMFLKSFGLSALGPAFAMKTAPMVERGSSPRGTRRLLWTISAR